MFVVGERTSPIRGLVMKAVFLGLAAATCLISAATAQPAAPASSPVAAELMASCASVIDQLGNSISGGQASAAQLAQFRAQFSSGLAPVLAQQTAADIPKMQAFLASPVGSGGQIEPVERCMTEARLRQLGAPAS